MRSSFTGRTVHVEMRLAVLAHRATATNVSLADHAWPNAESAILSPGEALTRLEQGDVALARLDVRETMDGVEPGLNEMAELERRGVIVLNPPRALLSAHDKLLTARLLVGAGVPHPETVHISTSKPPPTRLPLVLKPRLGSWGRDVILCRDVDEVAGAMVELRTRRWFREQGALAQELVPLRRHDLRLVVAGGRVVGAIQRVAAPGEWRTNVALGATRHPIVPPLEARRIAIAAAAAVAGDLVGVDLLPVARGRFVVIEVNGAVEFNGDYSLGRDVFAAAGAALLRLVLWRRRWLIAPADLDAQAVSHF